MKILINYANEKYRKAQRLNSWTGKIVAGFDRIYEFGPENVDEEYRRNHKEIFDNSRGDGLWLWKPYFINKVLESAKEGDYIFYCDSGAFFIKSLQPIWKILDEEGVFVTDYPLIECCFTKRSCFELLECNSEEFLYTNQACATFIGFKSCEKARSLVKDWLTKCEDKKLLEPESNNNLVYGNKYQFVSHREDQSLLSLLCKKRNIKFHMDISQRYNKAYSYFNEYYICEEPKHDDTYGALVFSHKMPKLSIVRYIRGLYMWYKLKKKYYASKGESK